MLRAWLTAQLAFQRFADSDLPCGKPGPSTLRARLTAQLAFQRLLTYPKVRFAIFSRHLHSSAGLSLTLGRKEAGAPLVFKGKAPTSRWL